ncbi:hypothetical protein H112_07862 [Trichophyton rubrum D6]|uniref:Uncharacterized protein n=3 Tax=Trichophyton TaxID=5550 RepID=A0A080WI30_TRIRC|nr:uncharacterized protein TERG_11570 [Trichophyton rubrum CBS 118892]EZF10944.1 hypothetical protein H100_07889 [Trichophyton rubrum MR850]EZF37811.1 hypothetical protein H102_07849 [Trichophyton rubrum CBS 100081]EZF48472.1 hypothetical protein H103_07874 [Trichophyton rubrum CBS 288.86]EZF59074.1 hypothetical protein H104_07821 [Trichophyton rubrum CBS 289.86]EZF69748.1 hypothetical protein H105_07874 [Trichophyton soudanense CBS 452.61]EZF91085.1 hypothetical protein H113_07932 [Trichophy
MKGRQHKRKEETVHKGGTLHHNSQYSASLSRTLANSPASSQCVTRLDCILMVRCLLRSLSRRTCVHAYITQVAWTSRDTLCSSKRSPARCLSVPLDPPAAGGISAD